MAERAEIPERPGIDERAWFREKPNKLERANMSESTNSPSELRRTIINVLERAKTP
jgi:hypothetical protein